MAPGIGPDSESRQFLVLRDRSDVFHTGERAGLIANCCRAPGDEDTEHEQGAAARTAISVIVVT